MNLPVNNPGRGCVIFQNRVCQTYSLLNEGENFGVQNFKPSEKEALPVGPGGYVRDGLSVREVTHLSVRAVACVII